MGNFAPKCCRKRDPTCKITEAAECDDDACCPRACCCCFGGSHPNNTMKEHESIGFTNYRVVTTSDADDAMFKV